MEISKMLTISTGHVSKETAELLDYDNINGIVVYQKDEYGWFILASSYNDYDLEEDLPKDLVVVLEFALSHGCEWLCLDCDGEVLDDLEVFDW